MGIADLFRPNWKHSKASVRESAIRQLGADQIDALLEIAETDPEPSLRELAIDRVDDPETLEDFAGRAQDDAVAQAARARADALWMAAATQPEDEEEAQAALSRIQGDEALAEVVTRSPAGSIRRHALERIQDPRALAELAKRSRDRAVAVEAIGRIQDLDILRGLALAEQRREVAQAALDRVEDSESLQLISQKGRVKAIRTRARRKLKDLATAGEGDQAEALANKKIHAQLVQLLGEVEQVAASTDWERAAAELASIDARWKDLQAGWTGADAKLLERYATLRKGFSLRKEQADEAREKRAREAASRAQEAAAPEALSEEQQEDLAARNGLLERLAALEGTEALAELPVVLAEWDALGPVPRPFRAEVQPKLDALAKQIRTTAAPTQPPAEDVDPAEREAAFEDVLVAAEAALSEETLGAARKAFAEQRGAWRDLERRMGRDAPLAGRFEALEVRLRQWEEDDRTARRERQEENLRRLQALLERAEAAKTLDSIVKLDRVLRDVRGALKKPGPVPRKADWNAIRPGMQAARDALVVRRRELEDAEGWKRWSNTGQQEKLIEEAEALLELDDLAETARRLRQCQARWKKLGPASRDKSDALWTRFRETCDKVHARCEVYFLEQDKVRQENLEKKTALCEQVEALQDSDDFSATADQIKGLQAEWKETGPVPRKQSDAVWKRFRAACDHFFDRRKAAFKEQDKERDANLEKKIALCEQAEALADSTEWEETANRLKHLQAEWKAIGPVPRKSSDSIWRRFRGACDQFFERRTDYQDEGRAENLSRRKELLESLARQLDAPGATSEAVGSGFLDAWSQWSSLHPVPSAEDGPTRERFHALIRRAQEHHRTAFLGSPLDPMMTEQKMESLCDKLDALKVEAESDMAAGGGSAEQIDTQDAEAMAARLKEALASSAFRKEQAAEAAQRIGEQARQLRRAWDHLPPLPEKDGESLTERFEAAWVIVSRALPKQEGAGRGDRRRGDAGGRRGRARRSPRDRSDRKQHEPRSEDKEQARGAVPKAEEPSKADEGAKAEEPSKTEEPAEPPAAPKAEEPAEPPAATESEELPKPKE